MGFYGCGSNAIAQTLTNCPSTYSFVMIVIAKNTSGTLPIQILTNGTFTYTRTKATTVWADWYNIDKTVTTDTITQNDVAIAANVSTEVTIPITKSGYTARGIVGIRKGGAGQGSTVISNYGLVSNGTTASITVYNLSTTDKTLSVAVTVLYTKD